jgi:Flavodoxin reductases (ferredoxin-NADPH reductases) family 1
MDAAITQGALPIEQARLYYGAQTPDLLIYRALAERCATTCTGFQVQCYAENLQTKQDNGIRPGRLDLAEIMHACSEPAATAFYLSGPKAMIDHFQQALLNDHGLTPEQVFIDAWD